MIRIGGVTDIMWATILGSVAQGALELCLPQIR